MKLLLHLHSLIFVAALLIPSVFFACCIWNLLPLYAQAETREAVRTAMMTVAEREGWLLSDMLVNSVTTEEMRLTHRQHIRRTDPETCVLITLADSSLHPCK